MNCILTALCGDLSDAIDEIEATSPGTFGPRGAYACGAGLAEMCLALAALVGPLVTARAEASLGWGSTTLMLAVWCATVVVPVIVSFC